VPPHGDCNADDDRGDDESGGHCNQRSLARDPGGSAPTGLRQRCVGAHGREPVWETRRIQLEDLLGTVEILELLLAEVDDAHTRRQVVGDELPCGAGEEDLPSVGRGRDPGGLVHAHSDVLFVAKRRGLAAVEAHPDANLGAPRPGVFGERPLPRDRTGERILCAREGVEEGVPLRVDLLPSRLLEGRPEETLVLREDIAEPIAQLLEQTCRALDVCEEESDRSSREVAHQASFAASVLLARGDA
jgi:hypothetical protein